ncbi:MAG: YgjP-like metallopeptidase domain-containing protein [Candidatus Peregrinibacteria bacterium]
MHISRTGFRNRVTSGLLKHMSAEPLPTVDAIPHRIERTLNRHSRATLDHDGTVIIRLARRLTQSQEQSHITSLLRRMAGVVAKEQTMIPIDPFRPLLEGATETILTFGDGRTRVVRLHAGPRTSFRQRDGIWLLTIGPHIQRRSLHRLLWNMIAKQEMAFVESLVDDLNDRTLQVDLRTIRMRLMSSRWGSCSSTGAITLNTALLFLPKPTLEYVIIHELAHRIHPNHSRHFWKTVEGVIPEYRQIRKDQHRFRLPNNQLP